MKKTHGQTLYGQGTTEYATQMEVDHIDGLTPFYWNASYPIIKHYASVIEAFAVNPDWYVLDDTATGGSRYTWPTAESEYFLGDVAIDVVNNSGVDDVFIDATPKNDPEREAIIEAQMDRMTGLVIHSGYRVSGSNLMAGPSMLEHSYDVFVEAYFRQSCDSAAEGEILLDALLEVPFHKYIIARAGATDFFGSTHDFTLAAYLIVANDYTFYEWVGDSAWSEDEYYAPFKEFYTEIGKPLGKAVKSGATYTREFENTLVVLDVATGESSIVFNPNTVGDWKQNNIGSPLLSGTGSHVNGVYSITEGGRDFYGTEDQFYFLSKDHLADGEMIARVNSVDNTHEWAKGGVMSRASSAGDAENVAVVVRPDNKVSMQWRSASGEKTYYTFPSGDTFNAKWIKLTRTGNLFGGHSSIDGASWTSLAEITVSMASDIQVGLVVTAHDDSQLSTALLSNLSVRRHQ